MKDPKKEAVRMARYWLLRCSELGVNVNAVNAVNAKENGKGKETFPPAPPIEKREGQEKTAATTARACTRESVHNFTPPTRDEVAAYAFKKGIPASFVDYWFECMETNYNPPWYNSVTGRFIWAWRRNLLVFWNKSENDRAWLAYANAHRLAAKNKPRAYTKADWGLCDERCQHFDATLCRCRCGCTVPPDKRPHPAPPEECERFHQKNTATKEGTK